MAESGKRIEMKEKKKRKKKKKKKHKKQDSFDIVSELNKKPILQVNLISLKYCKLPHNCFIYFLWNFNFGFYFLRFIWIM